MLLVTFPIQPPLRFPLLTLESILTFILFEFAVIHLIRYITQKYQKKINDLQELGYFFLFFGYSLMWVCFIISDYYFSSTEIISPFLIWSQGSGFLLFRNIGYYCLMIGAFLCVFCLERYKVYLWKKYLFSVGFLILITIFTIALFFDLSLTQTFSYFFWPYFIFFFLLYLVDFLKKVRKREKLVFAVLKSFGGFGIFAIGFLFEIDRVLDALGMDYRLFGAVLQLIGLGIISYFFISMPPFSEFDWQDKIEDIFLMNTAGICLYRKSFEDRSELIDQNLVAGAISSINMMLKEITETKEKGISVIQKQNKTIIILPSDQVAGIIFSKEDLNYIKVVLQKFVEKFETIFHDILQKWDGDLSIFKHTGNILTEILSERF